MKYPLTLTVDVSLADMAHGTPCNFSACPIALALQRMGYRNFSVTDKALTFANGVEYLPTRPAVLFIQLYDSGYVPRRRSFNFGLVKMPSEVAEAEGVLA